MPILFLNGERDDVIKFDISLYLTAKGKVIGDVTEASFMLKSDPTVDDVSAEYEGTMVGGQISVDGNSLLVKIDDYANIVVGESYYIGMGVKFSGDSGYREFKLPANKDTIKFRQDVIRE
jgi:hypothetical protein